MNRKKITAVAKGYLGKDKKQTLVITLFLSAMISFLLIGNQLFLNISKVDIANAEALAGKQHATYHHVSKEKCEVLQKYQAVERLGKEFSFGKEKDGTSFAYINKDFRYLGASVAKKNIKKLEEGHWAKKKDEVVFTRNYLEKNNLKIGDQVNVSLQEDDSNTGEKIFEIKDLKLKVVGIIDNLVGFSDRKSGYVSKELADSYIDKINGEYTLDVQLKDVNNISQEIKKINKILGYKNDDTNVQLNSTLNEALKNESSYFNQNLLMNFLVWIICVMVTYNIFYNRLFNRKRDFANLRKIGCSVSDLLKIIGMEFGIIILIAIIIGILSGSAANILISKGIIEPMVRSFDAENVISYSLSIQTVGSMIIVLCLVIIPSIFNVVLQLRKISPIHIVENKRTNKRKTILAILILSLSAILISGLSVKDNKSDSGIKYVKTYVPGELQITAGSISEGIWQENVSSISDSIIQKIEAFPTVKMVQTYDINYDSSVYLCPEKEKLNKKAVGYYEMLEEGTQKIDGKESCPYNMILATTNNIKKIVPSYKENKGEHVIIMEEGLCNALNLAIGDKFKLYDEKFMSTGSLKDIKNVSVKLIGKTKDMVLSESHVGPNIIIVDEDTAKILVDNLYHQVVNLWIEQGTEGITLTGLNGIQGLEQCSIHNAKQQMQEFINLRKNQQFLHWLFVALLTLIGVSSYFNTIFVNLLSRQRDFIVMYKIGISKKEIYQMVMKEGARHGLLIIGLVLVVRGIWGVVSKQVITIDLLYIEVILFAICVSFPVIIMWYIFRNKIVDSNNKIVNIG